MTPAQKKLLHDFAISKHGGLWLRGHYKRTAWSLERQGYVKSFAQNYYEITKAGREADS